MYLNTEFTLCFCTIISWLFAEDTSTVLKNQATVFPQPLDNGATDNVIIRCVENEASDDKSKFDTHHYQANGRRRLRASVNLNNNQGM